MDQKPQCTEKLLHIWHCLQNKKAEAVVYVEANVGQSPPSSSQADAGRRVVWLVEETRLDDRLLSRVCSLCARLESSLLILFLGADRTPFQRLPGRRARQWLASRGITWELHTVRPRTARTLRRYLAEERGIVSVVMSEACLLRRYPDRNWCHPPPLVLLSSA